MKISGVKLKELRIKFKMTQGDIAKYLGVSEVACARYDQGKCNPSIANFIKLAELFKTSVQYLVIETDTGKEYDLGNVTAFSERVKALRKERHMTQKQVAAELGIRETAYQAYEYGAHEPKLDKLLKLADLFQVTLDELLGRNEK